MMRICLLSSIAIIAAIGIAIASHEKTDTDSDRSRGDTWQSWCGVNPQCNGWNYYMQYRQAAPNSPLQFADFQRAFQNHLAARRIPWPPTEWNIKPVYRPVPLPVPRPVRVVVHHVAPPPHVVVRQLSPLEEASAAMRRIFGG
jgi:hypothetical protein